MRCFCVLLLFWLAVLPGGVASAWEKGKPIPRVLLGIYSSKDSPSPRYSRLHQHLEMPANHLGFDMHYHDVEQQPLPEPG